MKSLLRTLAVALSVFTVQLSVNAQDAATPPSTILHFDNYANLPQRVLYSAYANDGQNLYSLSGQLYNKRVSTQVMRFNPDANTWQVLSDKLTPKIQSTAVYVPSVHKIYVMGGLKAYGTGLFYEVETVDTETGEAKVLKVSHPDPGLNGGMAVWNNKVYWFGGSSRAYGSSRLYEFDVITEKFKRLADMPRSAETSGTVVNGVLYTFGGYNPFNRFVYREIYAYDIAKNSWKQVGKLPEQVSATSVTQSGNYIFLTGSYGKPEFAGYFDTSNNAFVKLKTNMVGRRYGSSAVINNKLFVYAGTSTIIDPGQVSVQGASIQPLLSAKN
ncbi:Kelch repeat-containing protein [Mucilaginibacter lacusdianchii]|uniref:Kelch repeat-containing protein n=1 Tax=Mucilaginibacter lacusdianchii TaxID=2684211 RepID=UPI00131E3597|nr:kelch repeat-containing protein [Mucilaginibacter sp. JXJ CY 39]